MSTLQNKIDFAVVFSVNKANPNGDPLDGNRPRINYDGYGEVSDTVSKTWEKKYLYNLMKEKTTALTASTNAPTRAKN